MIRYFLWGNNMACMKLLLGFCLVLLLSASNCSKQPGIYRDNPHVPDSTNDPYLDQQWYLGPEGANVKAAWEITKGAKDVTLGILDFIFEKDNRDFPINGQTCSSRSYEFVSQNGNYDLPLYHGSNVAQIAAACTNNGFGIAGVNWYSPVIAYDIGSHHMVVEKSIPLLLGINPCDAQDSNAFKECAQLVRNVDVLSTSFTLKEKLDISSPSKDNFNLFLYAEKAMSSGSKVWVAAAGNEGTSMELVFPNAIPPVITVGSTNRTGLRWDRSNFGRRVDIMAPGEDIAYMQRGSLVYEGGTSFSSPLVAGIVTLMKSVYPKEEREKYWNWKVAKYLIQKTARPMSCAQLCPDYNTFNNYKCQDIWCGDTATPPGLVDAEAAVKAAQMGLPKVPLIDTDKYLLIADNIIPHQTVSFSLRVFNRGGAKGRVNISSKHANISINQSTFDLDAITGPNASINIKIEVKTSYWGLQLGFIDIKAEGINNNDPYVDRHEVWVAF